MPTSTQFIQVQLYIAYIYTPESILSTQQNSQLVKFQPVYAYCVASRGLKNADSVLLSKCLSGEMVQNLGFITFIYISSFHILHYDIFLFIAICILYGLLYSYLAFTCNLQVYIMVQKDNMLHLLIYLQVLVFSKETKIATITVLQLNNSTDTIALL